LYFRRCTVAKGGKAAQRGLRVFECVRQAAGAEQAHGHPEANYSRMVEIACRFKVASRLAIVRQRAVKVADIVMDDAERSGGLVGWVVGGARFQEAFICCVLRLAQALAALLPVAQL
jgi:hypothetical protein